MIAIRPPTDVELHAFIDGELDEARTLEIADLVEADEALAARIAAFSSDKELIGRVFGGIDTRPLPPEWLDLIESRHSRPLSPTDCRRRRGAIVC